MRLHLRRALMGLCLAVLGNQAWAAPCLIIVHGKQTNTNTYTSYTSARNYWVNGSNDFVKTVTKNFTTPYYVVGYNGTKPYFDAQSAGEVANEIVAATNGIADAGGKKCSLTYAQGGTFWVVAHSMGSTVMDYVMGNSRTTDPNYNSVGPFSTVAARVSLVMTTGGAHRGSEGADAVCGASGGGCNFMASFIQDCDTATTWLRSADTYQVKTYSNAPAKNIYMTGGYEAIFGASACLSGEDDGVVQYASIFACNGSATASYNNSNVCGNSAKMKATGFLNLDGAHENHSNERDASDSDTRRQIPSGIWTCSGVPCAPNTVVHSSQTTAAFISTLY